MSVVPGLVTRILTPLASIGERAFEKLRDLGERLLPPTVTKLPVTFWLSEPQQMTVTVPKGTAVWTTRSYAQEPATLTTSEDLHIVPCALTRTASPSDIASLRDTTRLLDSGADFARFTEPPEAGDAIYLGLSNPIPSCVMRIRATCKREGAVAEFERMPIVWQAWNGLDWDACEVERDTTGGLRQTGEILLYVPRAHAGREVDGAAGWLRGVIESTEARQIPDPRQIDRLEAGAIGGSVEAVPSGDIDDEMIGVSGLRSPIPLISHVEVRGSAADDLILTGSGRTETQGLITRREPDRAVTPEDYELLALQATPEIARVRCLPIETEGIEGEAVRLLLVPRVDGSQPDIANLRPPPETVERVRAFLDRHGAAGRRLVLTPALYQGITIVARVRARRWSEVDQLATRVSDRLYNYFHPIHGGPAGDGWPFGRAVTLGQVYALLYDIPGCAFVEEAHLFAANPITGDRGPDVHCVAIVSEATVFSCAHQIQIDPPNHDA